MSLISMVRQNRHLGASMGEDPIIVRGLRIAYWYVILRTDIEATK